MFCQAAQGCVQFNPMPQQRRAAPIRRLFELIPEPLLGHGAVEFDHAPRESAQRRGCRQHDAGENHNCAPGRNHPLRNLHNRTVSLQARPIVA